MYNQIAESPFLRSFNKMQHTSNALRLKRRLIVDHIPWQKTRLTGAGNNCPSLMDFLKAVPQNYSCVAPWSHRMPMSCRLPQVRRKAGSWGQPSQPSWHRGWALRTQNTCKGGNCMHVWTEKMSFNTNRSEIFSQLLLAIRDIAFIKKKVFWKRIHFRVIRNRAQLF